jgi:hypothetical protein
MSFDDTVVFAAKLIAAQEAGDTQLQHHIESLSEVRIETLKKQPNTTTTEQIHCHVMIFL